MEYLKRTWAVVDLDHAAHNIRQIRQRLAPGCMLLGVVKADAYGHGDRYIAQELARQGVDWFGVSNMEEAMSLRGQGFAQSILIFGYTPAEHAALLGRQGLTQSVYSLEYGRELQEAAAAAGTELRVHIKVDTGMSRLGFVLDAGFPERSEREIAAVCALPNLRAEGIFTHFAVADELSEQSAAYTRQQYSRFQGILERLEQRGVRFCIRHCCNSGAFLNYPEMHLDMVRPGILLYGLHPSEDCARAGGIELRPVMELYSIVSQVKEIPGGTSVSYGRRYTAQGNTRVATVPIGYADGYARALSGKGRVLVRGQYANVIGRVCMDMLMLDVTHIPNVSPGDLVTIVGRDNEAALTFDEMARLTDTVHYEKICLIGKRVPRIYRRSGEEVGVLDVIRQQR